MMIRLFSFLVLIFLLGCSSSQEIVLPTATLPGATSTFKMSEVGGGGEAYKALQDAQKTAGSGQK